ncbi:uncharacterized protein Dwil_GK28001 [Drosophila willistoni]|uniref:Mitochondrial basic amino acids transporter n=1 Tax=Drosophila willistoni TaxID=7260 RepID=A0A0Q9X6M7_DROWI|nr:uncharacterized protein Dwil_GK28001 [Drosophila willistoni]
MPPQPIVEWCYLKSVKYGAAGVLVGHPLDTVKVHLQTDDPKHPKYNGTFHCLKTILLKDNIQGLYRGISSPMMGIGLVNAIVFGVYGNVQRLSEKPNELITHFWAGSIAGIAQGFVCSPMELAKTRLQLASQIDHGMMFKGPVACLKHIVKTEGLKGAFKGLTATILRDIPGFSCYFVSYEFIMRQRKQPSIPYTLLAGGCAGMASWLACYPIDVIKTHMQSDSLGNLAKYNGFVDCAIKGYGKEGIHFFFRGLSSTLIRAFPMNAACFFVVSWVLDFFNSKGVDMVVNPDKSLNIVNLENTNLGLQTCSSSPIDKLVRKIITNNNLEPSYDLQLTSDEVLRCSVKSYTNTTSQIDSERFTEKTK